MFTPKKLYRCPVCGEVVTDVELEAQVEVGGLPYCYCQYGLQDDGSYNREFVEYDVYVLEEKS